MTDVQLNVVLCTTRTTNISPLLMNLSQIPPLIPSVYPELQVRDSVCCFIVYDVQVTNNPLHLPKANETKFIKITDGDTVWDGFFNEHPHLHLTQAEVNFDTASAIKKMFDYIGVEVEGPQLL